MQTPALQARQFGAEPDKEFERQEVARVLRGAIDQLAEGYPAHYSFSPGGPFD